MVSRRLATLLIWNDEQTRKIIAAIFLYENEVHEGLNHPFYSNEIGIFRFFAFLRSFAMKMIPTMASTCELVFCLSLFGTAAAYAADPQCPTEGEVCQQDTAGTAKCASTGIYSWNVSTPDAPCVQKVCLWGSYATRTVNFTAKITMTSKNMMTFGNNTTYTAALGKSTGAIPGCQ